MRVVVVYRDNTDYARTVIDFMHDFTSRTGHTLDVVDPDTPEGIDFCLAHDVVEYPTIIALSNASIMQNTWRGLPLPTISEISYYTQYE